MSRLLLVVAVLVVVVVGALVFLSGQATEQPPVRVEKPVSLANMI